MGREAPRPDDRRPSFNWLKPDAKPNPASNNNAEAQLSPEEIARIERGEG